MVTHPPVLKTAHPVEMTIAPETSSSAQDSQSLVVANKFVLRLAKKGITGHLCDWCSVVRRKKRVYIHLHLVPV